MTDLFKKLNFKNHSEITILNSPASFELEIAEMTKVSSINTNIDEIIETDFVLCFVKAQTEIDEFIIKNYKKLIGDCLLWMCYPKGSSKKYKCDFNRDTGWAKLGQLGLETVRMVAIDEDWSALRFRKVEFVKMVTRRESYALTNDAKKRTSQKGV
jgi:hypothetical protein